MVKVFILQNSAAMSTVFVCRDLSCGLLHTIQKHTCHLAQLRMKAGVAWMGVALLNQIASRRETKTNPTCMSVSQDYRVQVSQHRTLPHMSCENRNWNKSTITPAVRSHRTFNVVVREKKLYTNLTNQDSSAFTILGCYSTSAHAPRVIAIQNNNSPESWIVLSTMRRNWMRTWPATCWWSIPRSYLASYRVWCVVLCSRELDLTRAYSIYDMMCHLPPFRGRVLPPPQTHETQNKMNNERSISSEIASVVFDSTVATVWATIKSRCAGELESPWRMMRVLRKPSIVVYIAIILAWSPWVINNGNGRTTTTWTKERLQPIL